VQLTYRPVVDLCDGRLVRLSVLAAIDDCVFGQACADLMTMRAAGMHADLSIHVSSAVLTDARLVSTMCVHPHDLWIEVTEQALADPAVASALRQLNLAGVRLAVDQFGMGHGNFQTLRDMRVDALTIDASFVEELGSDACTTAIARSLAGLGRDLGVEVVAEGVQTESQRSQLLALGCSLGQGRLFGTPLSCGEVIARFGTGSSAAWGACTERHDMIIDLDDRTICISGEYVIAPTKEFELLAFLAIRPGEVFSRNALLHHVWRSKPEWQDPRTVTEHVRRLRAKIEIRPTQPRFLRTLRGDGYYFNASGGTHVRGIAQHVDRTPVSA
jgi:EAL domain-containing protein (putative c-di-GMP-specific phosphodiesterase class I)/DNA-binding winged helix-turn-helix (wHTH) protein